VLGTEVLLGDSSASQLSIPRYCNRILTLVANSSAVFGEES
jgi:hypothetical protein